MADELRTAAWWVKSNHADAAKWRKEADFYAQQNMVLQAQQDLKHSQGKQIQIPPSEITQPPITAGRYFTFHPDKEGAPPTIIPTEDK